MIASPLSYPVPVPVELPTPSTGDLTRRALRTVGAFGAHLSPPVFRRLAKQDQTGSMALATAMRSAFDDLGATYLKVGQVVASSAGIVGEETASVFRSCLDTGPVVPFSVVRAAVERDLGRPLDEVFASFEPEPVGRASLAVVHRAALRDGRDVAVKVLRPGIEATVAADLALMHPLLGFLSNSLAIEAAGSIHTVVDGLRQQLLEELDLRNELLTMEHHRQLLARDGVAEIVIPRPWPEASSRRVLTMEFLDGVAVDHQSVVDGRGAEVASAMAALVRWWFTSAVRDGTFHGDVHAGNVLALPNGRLGLLDWGIVGRLDGDAHAFFRNVVEASLGNEGAWDAIAAFVVRVYGPQVSDSMGVTPDQLPDVFRAAFRPLLTAPFSSFRLADLMQTMGSQMNTAATRDRPKPSLADSFRHWLELRRQRQVAVDHGGLDTDLNRAMMLLVKQLVYFDRYGHLLLNDQALLDDPSFYAALLAEAPLVVRGS
ncbi:MAG: hypothetical protein JWO37_3760 [Acidimicrobiales bacterium]|jgi:aarF domain-containing kinase|nr:hypothetical protein [Acidimicrobiales bacterium]